VLKAGHPFSPSSKFEKVMRLTPTPHICLCCLGSRPSDKFSSPFFFRLRVCAFSWNQNVDNLNKHGELFPFSELLVKFPRISYDILLTLASDTKTKRTYQVEGRNTWRYRTGKEMVAFPERKRER
jgi:hypothetical protein